MSLGSMHGCPVTDSLIDYLRYVESFHPRRLPARRAHSRAPRAIDDDRHDRPDDDSRGSPGNPPRIPRKPSQLALGTPGIKRYKYM